MGCMGVGVMCGLGRFGYVPTPCTPSPESHPQIYPGIYTGMGCEQQVQVLIVWVKGK